MDNFEVLKLSRESSLIHIDDVPAHLRERFDASKAQFVLSRTTARRGALALDKNGAALVKLFAAGETLPRALKKLSVQSDLPLERLVEIAYPLLERLIQEEHLVPASEESSATEEKSHQPLVAGATFRDYTIVTRIQLLDDSVVYKAEASDGTLVALKILRGENTPAHTAFKREAIILKHLQGGVAPRLLEEHLEGGEVFMATEWIEGYSLPDWAARIRNLPHEQSYSELISLSKKLVDAYKELHTFGVFHGDIWTRNILIARDGSIRLLDFGLSSFSTANEALGAPDRATNAYFRSPDLAAAERNKTEPPLSSVTSEIYSLGVMLYFTITGRNYINFSYELEEQLRQVCEAPMLSFSENGTKSWPDMESLLASMLEKREGDRIQSLVECLERLEGIGAPQPEQASAPLPDPIPFIRSYCGERFTKPIEAPSASIFFGLGGLAYAMFRSGICLGESKLFHEADYLTACAKVWITSDPSGSSSPEADIPDNLLGPHSVYHRVEGIALIEALVAHTLGDARAVRTSCLRLISGIHKNQADAEFAFGKAGLLNTLLQLSFLVQENEVLIQCGNELADDILAEIRSFSSMSESPIRFVGFAHGWCGILYSLISWGRHYNSQLVSSVEPFLAELNQHKASGQLGSYWRANFDQPIEAGDVPSWCTGTAGFVLLWTEAFEATKEERWLALAREAGTHVALHQDMAFDLCCGLTGRALCLGTLYRCTGEPEWLEHAKLCLSRVKPTTGNFLHSLFKGFPGIELARVELARPNEVTFPLLAVDRYGERISIGTLARP